MAEILGISRCQFSPKIATCHDSAGVMNDPKIPCQPYPHRIQRRRGGLSGLCIMPNSGNGWVFEEDESQTHPYENARRSL